VRIKRGRIRRAAEQLFYERKDGRAIHTEGEGPLAQGGSGWGESREGYGGTGLRAWARS
jgi:hypothetical protein